MNDNQLLDYVYYYIKYIGRLRASNLSEILNLDIPILTVSRRAKILSDIDDITSSNSKIKIYKNFISTIIDGVKGEIYNSDKHSDNGKIEYYIDCCRRYSDNTEFTIPDNLDEIYRQFRYYDGLIQKLEMENSYLEESIKLLIESGINKPSLETSDDEYCVNPETGKWIKVGKRKFKELTRRKFIYTNGRLVKNPDIIINTPNKVRNPLTGRLISVNGPTYKKVIKMGYRLEGDELVNDAPLEIRSVI